MLMIRPNIVKLIVLDYFLQIMQQENANFSVRETSLRLLSIHLQIYVSNSVLRLILLKILHTAVFHFVQFYMSFKQQDHVKAIVLNLTLDFKVNFNAV
jgi:hypothetical protein